MVWVVSRFLRFTKSFDSLQDFEHHIVNALSWFGRNLQVTDFLFEGPLETFSLGNFSLQIHFIRNENSRGTFIGIQLIKCF